MFLNWWWRQRVTVSIKSLDSRYGYHEEPGQPLRVSLGHVSSPRKIWLGLILSGQRCNENKEKKKVTKARSV
jgi:hypothetical protein